MNRRIPIVVAVLAALITFTAPAPGDCPANIAIELHGSNPPTNLAVDLFDLLLLIDNWGTSGPGAAISAEGGGPAIVDLFDLLALLDNWGTCPGTPCHLPQTGTPVPDGWTGPADCNDNCWCIDGVFDCDTNFSCLADCDDPNISFKPVPHGNSVPFGVCDTCTCMHGQFQCTELDCFEGCEFMGKPLEHGEFIFEGCAQCFCLHGVLQTGDDCDDDMCDCVYMGVFIADGSSQMIGCRLYECNSGTATVIDDSACDCTYMGTDIPNGDTVMIGCELVTCTDGDVSVDDSGCP